MTPRHRVDSQGRAHGHFSRPFEGLMDGWRLCPECDEIGETLYGEAFECTWCGYRSDG